MLEKYLLLLPILLLVETTRLPDEPVITHPTFGLTGQIAYGNLDRHPDGRIFCTLASKPKKRWERIYISSTADAGKSWSDAVKVMDIEGQTGYIADPNVLVSPDGVRVFATYVPMKNHKFSRSEFLVSHSSDGIHNWSKPTPIEMPYKYKCGKVHVPVWLDASTVVMPFCWDVPAQENRAAASERQMFERAGVLISKDAGKTWKPGGDIVVDIHPIGADEAAIVKLKNNDIFAIVRTSSEHPYETRSHDGGLTWDTPVASKFFALNSPSALLRLSNGIIIRAWNNSPKERYPLVVSATSDECTTWSAPKAIIDRKVDPDGKENLSQAAYPSIAQAHDGTILLVWTETNEGKYRLGTARFQSEWLAQPK